MFRIHNPPMNPQSVRVGPTSSAGNESVGMPPSFVPGLHPAQSFDGFANFNQGFGANNFSAVNATIVQQFSERFPAQNVHIEMLSFIVRSERSKWLQLQSFLEVASLAALNKFLVTPQGRDMYGKLDSASLVLDHFAFAGKYNVEIPNWALGCKNDWESNITISRIARVASVYTRSCVPKDMKSFDPLMHSVYLMLVRRKILLEDLKGVASDSIARASGGAKEKYSMNGRPLSTGVDDETKKKLGQEYYWQFEIKVQESKAPPAPYLYCDDESTGACYKIGYITEFSPEHSIKLDEIARSRNAVSGIHNCLHKENDYIELTEKASYVNIALRC